MNNIFPERFWKKVNVKGEDDCWEWTAGRFAISGYGAFWNGHINVGSHRVSWQLLHGDIPIGMQICHTCDNPPCVNPNHLFLGTAQDNSNDKWKKGRGSREPVNPNRQARGERCHTAKLTQNDVNEIRKVYAEKIMTTDMLAKEYGVTRKAIKDVIANRTWKSDKYIVPERWGIHNPIMRGK